MSNIGSDGGSAETNRSLVSVVPRIYAWIWAELEKSALRFSGPANTSKDGRSVDEVEKGLQFDDPEVVESALDFIRRLYDEEIHSATTLASKAGAVLAALGLLGPFLVGLGGFYFRPTSAIHDCTWITVAVGLLFSMGIICYLIAAKASLRAVSVSWYVRPAEEIVEQYATSLLHPGENSGRVGLLSTAARFKRREVAALLISYERNKRAHEQIAISLIVGFFGMWLMVLFIVFSGAVALGYLLVR